MYNKALQAKPPKKGLFVTAALMASPDMDARRVRLMKRGKNGKKASAVKNIQQTSATRGKGIMEDKEMSQ
jgi:hypothetical protein